MAYTMILIRGACHYVEPQNTNTTLQVHRGGLDKKKKECCVEILGTLTVLWQWVEGC